MEYHTEFKRIIDMVKAQFSASIGQIDSVDAPQPSPQVDSTKGNRAPNDMMLALVCYLDCM